MNVNINLFNNSDSPIHMILEIEDPTTNSTPVSIIAGPLIPRISKKKKSDTHINIDNYLPSKHLNVFIPINNFYNIIITIPDKNEEYDFSYDMTEGSQIDLIYSGSNDLSYFVLANTRPASG